MGYYTLHKISIINEYNTERNLEILSNKILEISGYGFGIVGSVIYDSSYNSGYGSKWYNCRADMRLVSEELPELEIRVVGKGEEGEVWEYIYENGYEYGGDCSSFSDVDEEPHFEEENDNNRLHYYEEEIEEDIEEESEEEENYLDNGVIEEEDKRIIIRK